MLTRDAILAPVADEHIANFMRPRRKPGPTVEVAPHLREPTWIERAGRFLESRFGAGVWIFCMAFGAISLITAAVDAVARARGF
jgi:hypothetical protein